MPDITLPGEFFNDTLLIFRIFRVDTKSFEAKLSPLGFVSCFETIFFFNLTEQLFYFQYFIIVCLSFFWLGAFFPKLSFDQRVPSRLHRWFRLKKDSCSNWKFLFRHYEIFPRKIDFFQKWVFLCFQLGKCGFWILCVSFEVFFGTEKVIKN